MRVLLLDYTLNLFKSTSKMPLKTWLFREENCCNLVNLVSMGILAGYMGSMAVDSFLLRRDRDDPREKEKKFIIYSIVTLSLMMALSAPYSLRRFILDLIL